jgi:hypothetical protein
LIISPICLQQFEKKKTVVEDSLFGYRAAAPALLCNDSYFTDKAVRWDPEKLKVV